MCVSRRMDGNRYLISHRCEMARRRREEKSAAEIYINFKDVASVAWIWPRVKKKNLEEWSWTEGRGQWSCYATVAKDGQMLKSSCVDNLKEGPWRGWWWETQRRGGTPSGCEAMSKAERYSGSLHRCQKMSGMPKNIPWNHHHKSLKLPACTARHFDEAGRRPRRRLQTM